jgi:mono/diheme cytochrome c family protein
MHRTSFLLGSLAGLIVAATVRADGPATAGSPTFTKDVAPILYSNCVSCHRTGDIAPMPLMTYEDVRPWAKAIRTQVAARTMPPWGADPAYGKFRNDRSLSQAQIDTIAAWVESGMAKGDPSDLPPVPAFVAGWSHGEPDAVVEMPIAFDVPAEGQVDVTDFYVQVPFDHDVYIKALEVRPGVPAVVHHAGLYVVDKLPPNAKLVDGRVIGADGKQMSRRDIARAVGRSALRENDKLLSYVPGRGYEAYQGGAGQRIKAGSYINFYMHYQPNGKAAADRTKLGLYFAKTGQEVTHQIYHSLGDVGPTTYIVDGKQLENIAQDDDLPPIPPYVDDWKVVSVHAITEPITIYGLTPHLHLRGKSMKYTVTWPDGRDEVLLSVPKYDFNWQVYYELDTPRHIPAGSKITVTTLFDNSPKNRYNPAPEKAVFWSEQSWDEMYAPQVRVTIDSRDLKKAGVVTTAPQKQ